MRLFVYGTLKRGGCNHRHLHGQRFIAEASTQARYRLFDLGGYPGMVLDETEGRSIEGEIWEVDAACLRLLDLLEDTEGGEYLREPIPLCPPHSDWSVEGYRYLRSVAGFADIGNCWRE